MTPPLRADLVLEGGGVKGLALVGAVEAFAAAGYTFPRVAGSSVGAVVGSVVAALQAAGRPLTDLGPLLDSLDLRRFRDPSGVARLPLAGPVLSSLLRGGAYDGAYLHDWLGGVLADLGVRTFGDLRLTGEAAQEQKYGLVVTTSDLTRQRLVRLPWDLAEYGLDPDAYPVAAAVQASAAIPYVFRPVQQKTGTGSVTWVDGGLLSNFPVELFDRAAGPRWPTFGVRLLAEAPQTPDRPVSGALGIGLAALDVLLTDQGRAYLEEPCTRRRTVHVPTQGVSVIDFDLDRAGVQRLREAGRAAAQAFLATWDDARYVRDCR